MVSIRVLLLLVGVTAVTCATYDVTKRTAWWQTTSLYQIWPNSFKDSDGDGIGDFNGITSKLGDLADMGVEAIWLSPFYSSPMVDSGYDVSDYRDVNPIFGTLDDLKKLLATAKELGLKVVVDFVPNHVSDQHEWFVKAKKGVEPYVDYFVWNEGKVDANGTRQPPNNWITVFDTGSAWEWVEERQAYYLHQFGVQQVDLNFTNPMVIQETKDVLTYWLDLGVDGFRLDAVNTLIEDPSLADEPLSGRPGVEWPNYYYLDHFNTKDFQATYDVVQQWADLVDNYTATINDGAVRAMFSEVYANISKITEYYEYGVHIPFNFFFIRDGRTLQIVEFQNATDVVDTIELWMDNMPSGGAANWVLGNHDNSRIATRYGSERVDLFNILLFLLPGVATIYNGDEIGMPDTFLTYEETIDLRACVYNASSYQLASRDPQRTPYQWDNTTSAGFSTNSTPILPVNPNYLTLNLATQKEADVSHYKVVQALLELRKTTVVREGSLNVQVIDDQVIAFSRELESEEPIAVLLNWENTTVTVSTDVFKSLPNQMEVLIADINSGISVGTKYERSTIELPGSAAVVLRGITPQKKASEGRQEKRRKAKASRRKNALVFG